MTGTELDIARQIASGALPSPQPLGGGLTLWALRLTGSGFSVRPAYNEAVFRSPEIVLSPDFVDRVAGIPVIWNHPPGAQLSSTEYAKRVIGACMFGFVATADGIASETGDELWTIARIQNDGAAEEMASGELSTSPAVFFAPDDGNQTAELGDGTPLLIEGNPSRIDHLAVLSAGSAGVWDKGGTVPLGVRVDSETLQTGTQKMPDETKPAGEAPPWQAVLDALTGITKRLDALETKPALEPASSDPTRPAGNEYSRANDREAAERDERASLQARFDAIFNHHSDQAPPPMAGEKAADYRVRLLRLLQRHSADFRNVNLEGLRADALGAIESRIIADSIAASKTPAVAPGLLREVRRRDPMTGQQIIDFVGDPSVWMDQFGMRPMFVTRINNGSERR